MAANRMDLFEWPTRNGRPCEDHGLRQVQIRQVQEDHQKTHSRSSRKFASPKTGSDIQTKINQAQFLEHNDKFR